MDHRADKWARRKTLLPRRGNDRESGYANGENYFKVIKGLTVKVVSSASGSGAGGNNNYSDKLAALCGLFGVYVPRH